MKIRDGARSEVSARDRSVRQRLIRAGVFFGILLLLDLAIIAFLLFRDLDRRAITEALGQAHANTLRLAESIGRVSAPDGGFDYFRIREKEQVLYRVFNEFLARMHVVRSIELIDPNGNVVLRFRAGEEHMVGAPDELPFGFAPPGPEGPRSLEPGQYVFEGPQQERLVRVAVPGGPVGATLQVGIAEDALEAEAREVRRSLLVKLAVGGALSLLILTAAFAYVLRLLRRIRRAEAERQIAERLAYVGTLASGLAHEIRNPLNAMNMNLQMLEEEMTEQKADGESLGLLGASRAEVRRLEQLVQDFLAYARPREASRRIQDPGGQVTTVVDFLRPEFEKASVALVYEPPEALPRVSLDDGQFRQALVNVLQNALQASTAGSTVTVRAAATPESGVRVEVADEGPGISPDRLEKIFDVFYSERPGGTGLGLPIAQRVLESHGGEIDIRSEPGRGTTVVLLLPRGARGATPPPDPEEPAAAAEGP